MAGAPTQLDLFDNKPALQKYDGQEIPAEFIPKGERFAFIKGTPRLLGFAVHVQEATASPARSCPSCCRTWPTIADDIAIVRSVHTTQFNHAPGQIFMNTGSQVFGRPSMGSWLTYGLGSESRDLPGFVVLLSGENAPDGGKSCWGSGFLPTVYQGVEFRSKGDPVLFVSNPDGVGTDARRELDRSRHRSEPACVVARVGDPEIDTRIASYEMAYRMQTQRAGAHRHLERARVDPRDVRHGARQGVVREQLSAGAAAGRARRAVRAALSPRLGHARRQRRHRHRDEESRSSASRPIAPATALVRDLKQRGLLDTTLVIWGGEFGRTPMNEARGGSKLMGRDHHPRAFTIWMAGGGVKPGITIGRTDDLGYNVVEDPVEVHDLHATILHLMGLDHTKLTYKFQGREFRLTDVHGNVVTKLLA